MKPFGLTLSALLACAAVWAAAARAETPYERNQREQLEKYQREHGLSPQVEQAQRWEREWKEQHPGQPVPNAGVLQKLHRDETTANIHAGFAQMRAQRQAELRRQHQMARDHQARQLAARHITWTPAQWQAWERQYDLDQQRRAQDYLKATQQAAEIDLAQREREEDEKRWKQQR